MIRKVGINNYKSIPALTLDLGRITVLIGANGSGKSNILEAIALGSAAAQSKLDNEFLISRGIRVTATRFMRAAFRDHPPPPKAIKIAFRKGEEPTIGMVKKLGKSIIISVRGDDGVAFDTELSADQTASYPKWKWTSSYPNWRQFVPISTRDLINALEATHRPPDTEVTEEFFRGTISQIAEGLRSRSAGTLLEFLVYCPENSALRTFQSEGQILPLGIRGEGLFAHLKALDTDKNRPRLVRIKETLKLIDWFESFDIPDDLSPGGRTIRIRDRYLPESARFDQRSANEGFLFLLFYVTLLTSPDTPAFFSIDNVENCLNPKLCVALLQQIVILAKEYDKQVILTTHSPAVLDGLDLTDDEQRLLVVERNKAGHTRVRRVDPPKPSARQVPVSLSEAFMRGYIGGLPKNF